MYKENPEKALKLADEIIKNTYRTLMTRGMKGCYVYCEDMLLQGYFKEKLEVLMNGAPFIVTLPITQLVQARNGHVYQLELDFIDKLFIHPLKLK